MEDVSHKTERYDAIDGLRAFAAIGIVLMHVLANGGYEICSQNIHIYEFLIPAFGDFVFLFMMISSFSMCCGYYDKIINCKITPEAFYSRRFSKIWPFFALLTVLDILIAPSRDSIYEAFANLTLCYGLLPNASIEVIGVGWTLGVIFASYLLFPFFCFLLSNIKRAWLTVLSAAIWNYVCDIYFFDGVHVVSGFSGRSNILYSSIYFVSGGVIYLYRKKLTEYSERFRLPLLVVLAACAVHYVLADRTTVVMLCFFSLMVIYAVGRGGEAGVLNNALTRFLSGISMEIYLCHMVAYRVAEKAGLIHLFASDVLSYWFAAMITIIGAVGFSAVVRWGIDRTKRIIDSRR